MKKQKAHFLVSDDGVNKEKREGRCAQDVFGKFPYKEKKSC